MNCSSDIPIRFSGKAEEEGFEPPDLLQSTVFKTAALNHSAIPPEFLALFRFKAWQRYFEPGYIKIVLLENDVIFSI